MRKYIITQLHTTLLVLLTSDRGKQIQCVETRPSIPTHYQKLLEVSYRRTSQHNKGLLTLSSLVLSPSVLKGVLHKEHACHVGLQNFNAHHWIDSRCTLDPPPGTMMKTDEDEDRLTLRTSELACSLAADNTPD